MTRPTRTVDARGVVTVEGIRYRLYNERDTGGACVVHAFTREGPAAEALGPGAWVTMGEVSCPIAVVESQRCLLLPPLGTATE